MLSHNYKVLDSIVDDGMNSKRIRLNLFDYIECRLDDEERVHGTLLKLLGLQINMEKFYRLEAPCDIKIEVNVY